MKENLKPDAYKQTEHYVVIQCDVVLFVERAGELRWDARLRDKVSEPKRKRV